MLDASLTSTSTQKAETVGTLTEKMGKAFASLLKQQKKTPQVSHCPCLAKLPDGRHVPVH